MKEIKTKKDGGRSSSTNRNKKESTKRRQDLGKQATREKDVLWLDQKVKDESLWEEFRKEHHKGRQGS